MVKHEEIRGKAGRRINTEGEFSERSNSRKTLEYHKWLKNENNLGYFDKRKLSKSYNEASLNFISNAKPSFLRWRDVKVISAPIAKPNKVTGEEL